MDLSDLKPAFLLPLPTSLRGSACSYCDKTQSSFWLAVKGEEEARFFVCSLCVVNESEWANEKRDYVLDTLRRIEQSRKEIFTMKDGKLTDWKQADHLVGLLVLIAKIALSRMGLSKYGTT